MRLGDVAATGRLRLDALARYLQDVAYDDGTDGGAEGRWVLRRMLLEIERRPHFEDSVRLVTRCTGAGSRWAERRTVVSCDARGGRAVEATALWVHLDPAGRPSPLRPSFFATWGHDVPQVSARLRLPGPPPGAPSRPWPLRATDIDVLGHVNNAIALAAVEDEFGRAGVTDGAVTIEVEYRDPIDVDDPVLLVTATDDDGARGLWLTVAGRPRVSVRVRGKPATGADPQ